ncbi:MAG TPA: hypothetical protein VM869_09410, partial [Enhygromyxa sp.]|nr:hypothetical protein [Enhygromyxa sp.]
TLRGGDQATPDDHLVELLVHEGHVYVANSNSGLAAMRLEPDGGVTLTYSGPPESEHVRCTSVAVHAPSNTLYCGSDEPLFADVATLVLFDLSSPGQPVLRERFELIELSTRDLVVLGDQLLVHHFHGGLWTAAIGSDGTLTQLADTGIEGNARVSTAVGDRIVTLFGDVEGPGAELRLLDPTDWCELDRMSLSGPPVGLSADASGAPRVAVGLGSGGMAVVDVIGDELSFARLLEPPAVVTHGLLDGELAAAVTLSGVFAWSLPEQAEQAARLFGFGPAAQLDHRRAGNMLHGLFVDGEILTSDWLHVERWALDPSGEVVDLDVPRGLYLAPAGPIRWRVRNPGGIPLRAEFWLERERVLTQEVAPGEVVELELSEALRQRYLAADEPSTRMIVRSYDVEIPSAGEPLSSAPIALVQRDPSSPLPPATGEHFPTLALVELDLQQTYSFPPPGGGQTIWLWPDCAMIWPQLEDLAWLARQGVDLDRGEPIFLVEYNVQGYEFAEQWGLAGVRFGLWGPEAPPEVWAANSVFGDDIYAESFFIQAMPGDAMPTDYVVEADGTIRSIERMYRGPWTLF